MPESEKVGVALRVMPLTVDHSIIRDLRKSADYETLIDNLTEEVNFMREHRRGPSLDKAPAGVVDDDEGQGENDDADEDEKVEETMDPMMVATLLQAAGDNQEAQQQVLALAAGRFKNVGKTFGKFRKRPPTPPTGTGLRRQNTATATTTKGANCINYGKRAIGQQTAQKDVKIRRSAPASTAGSLDILRPSVQNPAPT